MFTEANPDKGTETRILASSKEAKLPFTEANPDKGMETKSVENSYTVPYTRLQKLTPIRGRKHFSGSCLS